MEQAVFEGSLTHLSTTVVVVLVMSPFPSSASLCFDTTKLMSIACFCHSWKRDFATGFQKDASLHLISLLSFFAPGDNT